MVRKKRNNGKKILSIGLRAANPNLATPGDHFDTDFVEDDEESPSSIMGSTGPKGERKKKIMADILESTTSLGSQMMDPHFGASIWKFSLVGQVLGINVRFKAMESFVKKVWSHLANPEICLLKPGVFLFNFNSKDEMNEILMSGPWFFGSRHFLLKAWSMGDDFEKADEHIYPMWIQFPALKLNLWNEKGIRKIASLIGHPIATDKLTANRKRLAYARVLVQVTLPSSLPDQVVIKGPNGCSYTQRVIYELKPRWCDHCKKVGHDNQHCKRKPMKPRWCDHCKKVGHDNQHCKRKPMVQRWIPKQAQDGISGKQEAQIDQTVQEQNAKSVIDVEISPTENRKGKEVLQEINQTTGKDFGICQEGVNSIISGEHYSVHVVHAGQNTSRKSTQNEASRIQMQNQERKNSMIMNPFSLLNSEINDFDHFTIDRGDTKVPEAANRIAKNWSWFSNATCSAKARILILWDPDVLDIQVLFSSPQQITCSVNSKDGNFSSILSAVYGLNHQETRKNLWMELAQIKQTIGNEAWLLCGDFNVMISNEEKLGGIMLTENDTRDF
ncbi:uncharacterized protein LOC109838885 [Asparagus officinalis]|uniref:uncharacterized protein LOC109838885 n=1 Tax=Asparagus officinalis TaxID=4686 RepID=UPI00098E5EB6|nr:uncharacterized protein LOC109838885 [Asparagus officinalis]